MLNHRVRLFGNRCSWVIYSNGGQCYIEWRKCKIARVFGRGCGESYAKT